MITKGIEIRMVSPIDVQNLTDSNSQEIMSNLLRIAEPLRKIHSRKAMDIYLNRVLPEYMLIKFSIVGGVLAGAKEVEDKKRLISDTNGTVYDVLRQARSNLFASADREFFLEILQENIKIVNTATQVPKENAGALYNAFIKGSSPIQKLDLILTVILLIAADKIPEFSSNVIHNLCVLAGKYLNEFRTHIFINNPVLKKRLQEPGKTISDVDMERLLAVSG